MSAEDVWAATRLYRKLLTESEDRSVTIITTGYLTNVYHLLNSTSDDISRLKGFDLTARKVKQLVIMGGEYPAGKEWNFKKDSRSSRHVVAKWP